jgi:hypothetical protein
LAGRKEQIEEENNAKMASKPYQLTVDGAGFEPATSAMPTPRSFQADLPAQLSNHARKLLSITQFGKV